MKKLILSRHAKSSWSNQNLRDIERPLNKRGKRAAPVMGEALRSREHFPDAVFSSPSVRTRMTSGLLTKELGFPADEIQFVDSFYGASPAEIDQFARKLDDQLNSVMLVGHNPTWTDLCVRFTGKSLDNLPTAGVLVVEFDVDHWSDISNRGRLVDLLIPRDFGHGGGQ